MLAFLPVSKARLYKSYIFRQCVCIVCKAYPRSNFHRVTYFAINEYKIQLWHYEKYVPLTDTPGQRPKVKVAQLMPDVISVSKKHKNIKCSRD